MRVAVFGAGAVGGLIGARLASEAEVVLIGRPAFARAVRRNGLRIAGPRGGTFRVAAATRADAARSADLVILTTKAYDTEAAAAQLARARVGAPILSLQNGLTNLATLRRALPRTVLLGGSIVVGVIREAPGRLRYTGGGRAVIGSARRGEAMLKEVAALFSRAGIPTQSTNDLKSVLWSKAIVNAAVNPLTAILHCPNGEILRRPETRLVSMLAAREASAAGRADGIRLPADPWPEVARVLRDTPTNRTSMLQDVEAHRRTEIDAITGEIVRVADARRIPVPVNRALLALVRAVEPPP